MEHTIIAFFRSPRQHNFQLIKILHYDGTPITARFIVSAIQNQLEKISVLSDQKHQELV
jgi:hypothetical protein